MTEASTAAIAEGHLSLIPAFSTELVFETSASSLSAWDIRVLVERYLVEAGLSTDKLVRFDVVKSPGRISALLELPDQDSIDTLLEFVSTLGGSISLKGSPATLRIRQRDYHSLKKMWREFFFPDLGERNADHQFKHARTGERPDTLHITDLPVAWFSDSSSAGKPSAALVSALFGKFGPLRHVEILGAPITLAELRGEVVPPALRFALLVQYETYAGFKAAVQGVAQRRLKLARDFAV
jgi:hypothetical protein